jgi:hypothetical protein
VLIDDHESIVRLRHDIGLMNLRTRSAERTIELIGCRFETRDRGISSWFSDVECGLRGFRKAGRRSAPDRGKTGRPRR